MTIETCKSIATLNANRLNALTKRHSLAEWIQRQYLSIYLYIHILEETDFKFRDTYRLKVKEWKKLFHENGNQSKNKQMGPNET